MDNGINDFDLIIHFPFSIFHSFSYGLTGGSGVAGELVCGARSTWLALVKAASFPASSLPFCRQDLFNL